MYRVGDVAIVLHDVKLRKLPLRRVQHPHILSFKDRDPLGRDIAHKVHKLICVFEGLIDYELCVEVIAHHLQVVTSDPIAPARIELSTLSISSTAST